MDIGLDFIKKIDAQIKQAKTEQASCNQGDGKKHISMFMEVVN